MEFGEKRGIFFLIILVTFCLCALPASADGEAGRLTKQNVTAFIQKTTALMAGHADNMDTPAVHAYLEKHLHKDSRFKSTMRYLMPGFPTQEQTMTLDKEKFLENIEAGNNGIEDYDTDVEILRIKIAGNKKSATVTTRGHERAMMPVKDEDGKTEDVNLQGLSTCTQILMLSKKDVIQMYNATCVTDIEFAGF